MNTKRCTDTLKRAVAWILTVTLLIEQPLWAASELIALKRARAVHVEGKSLWLLGLEGTPDKEGTYHWSLGGDLAALDKPLYIGTGKGQVTAAIEPGEPGKGLIIRTAAPLCLDAIDKALSIPLVVLSEVSLTLGDVTFPGPFGGAARWVRMDTDLTLTHPFALQATERLEVKGLMNEGSISLSAPAIHNTRRIASDDAVALEGDITNQGDIYGKRRVHLKGKTLINKGTVRSRHGVLEQAHTLLHDKGSLVFAGIYHQLEAFALVDDGQVVTFGLSQQRVADFMNLKANYRFNGRRLLLHATSRVNMDSYATIAGKDFIGISSKGNVNAFGTLVMDRPIPLETFYKGQAYHYKEVSALGQYLNGYLYRHPLPPMGSKIILTAGGRLSTQRGRLETLLAPIVYEGKEVLLGSQSVSGAWTPATTTIKGKDVDIDAVMKGTLKIPTLEALLVDVTADTLSIKGDVKAPVRAAVGGGSAAVSGKVMGPMSVKGGSLEVLGSVMGDIHAELTRTLTLSGTHEGDLWAKVGELFKVTESGRTVGSSLTVEAGAFASDGRIEAGRAHITTSAPLQLGEHSRFTALESLMASGLVHNRGTIEVGGIGELPFLHNTGRALFSTLRYGSDSLDNTGGSLTVGQLLRSEGVSLINEGGRAVVGSMTLPALDEYTFTGTTVIGSLERPWHLQRLLNTGNTTLLSGTLEVGQGTRNTGKLAFGNGTFSLGHLHNAVGGDVTFAGRSRIQLFNIQNQGTLHAPSGLRIGQGAWTPSLDQAHQSWTHMEAAPHTLSHLGRIEGGGLALDLRNAGDLPGYLRAHQDNWAVEGVTLFAPTQDWVLTQALHVPSALSMHIRDYTSRAALSGEGDMGIQGRAFTHTSMEGTLTTPGKVRIHVDGDMDNRQGRIWGGGGLQGYAGKRILVGEGIAEGPHWVKRNGAYVASGGDLDLEGAQGIRVNFGEVVGLGEGRLASAEDLYLNSALLRIGGKAHIQTRSLLAKMNDITTRGASICDSRFWCNQWRQHFTGDPTTMLFGGDVHLDLGNQNPGNLTLIGSKLAAMGRVYDRSGTERTATSLGTFNLRAVELWEHAEKNPGDKWQGTHHKQIGIAHSTFSTSGPVDLNFGTYDLGAAKVSAASLNLKGLQAQIDGREDQMGTYTMPGIYQDLREGLGRIRGGVTGYRTREESPQALYTTGPTAHGVLPWEKLVIAAPRGDQARVQARLQSLMESWESQGRVGLPLRFLMDTPTTLAALQDTLLRNTLKGYLYSHTDGSGHVTRLTESARTLAGGSTLENRRVAILEELASADTPALVYVLDTDAHGEEILRPVVIRPHQTLDSLLQTQGTSVVANDGPLNVTTQGSQFAIRTNWGSITDLNLTALEGDIIARAIRAKAQAGSMQGRSVLIGNDHDVSRSVVCGGGSYRETITVTSVPSILEMPLFQALATEGDATFQHMHFRGNAFKVDVPKGKVRFEMGRSSRYTFQVDQESSMPYNTTTVSRSESHDYSQNEFSPEAILTINARDGIQAQETHSQKAAFLWDVRTSGATGYGKPSITTEMLYPYSHTETQEHKSLNPLFQAAMGLGIALATQGLGASYLGATSAFAAGAADAGFSAFAALAATQTLAHEGNLGRALPHMFDRKAFNEVGRAALTASIIGGAGLSSNASRLTKVGLHMGAEAIATGLTGGNRDQIFENSLRGGIAALIQGSLATATADARAAGKIGGFVTSVSHMGGGALSGYIQKGRDGVLPGMAAALIAHHTAHGLYGLEGGPSADVAARLGIFTAAMGSAGVAAWQGSDVVEGFGVGASVGSINVHNNFLGHLEETDDLASDDDDTASVGTNDGAEETGIGQAHNTYQDLLDELTDATGLTGLGNAAKGMADATGLTNVGRALGEHGQRIAGGEEAYVETRLAQDERLRGRPFTSSEKEVLSQTYRDYYHEDADALSMLRGFGAVGNIGGAVDGALRYSGLTDKYTARAVGWAVDDAVAAISLGGVTAIGAKHAAKFAYKKGVSIKFRHKPGTGLGGISEATQAEIDGIRSLKGYFAQHSSEVNALRAERLSRQAGLERLKAQGEGVTIELTHNVGGRADFERKLSALQDLAERGRLSKATASRNERVTFEYRKSLLARAEAQWGASDPLKFNQMKRIIKNLQADHLHELQLGGIDHPSYLTMLDSSVNSSVGSQIMHQLKKLPEGTPIRAVIEKGATQ